MLALERGWSVNLGGGFHHCSSNRGSGFCAYADVTLAVRLVREQRPDVSRVMIVDLDASQVRMLCRIEFAQLCMMIEDDDDDDDDDDDHDNMNNKSNNNSSGK